MPLDVSGIGNRTYDFLDLHEIMHPTLDDSDAQMHFIANKQRRNLAGVKSSKGSDNMFVK